MKTFRFLIIFLLFSMGVQTNSVAACDFFPIPYFLESFEIDHTYLPADVEVNGIINSQVGFESWGVLEFVNHTDEPVYVIEASYRDDLTTEQEDSTDTLENKLTGVLREKTFTISAQTDSTLLPISGYGNRPIDFQSNNWTGQVHPENLQTPAPHTITLLLVTNGNIFDLPVTISYEENPDYRDQPCPMDEPVQINEPEPTPGTTETPEVSPNGTILLGGLILAGLVLWLLWRKAQTR